MYERLRHRLTSALALNLSEAESCAILARAYAHESYDPATQKLSTPLPGYQRVKEPSEVLNEDPQHQMMEFMRMALNLSMPGRPDVRKGISEKVLISTMWGFSNFDALVNYVKSDFLDPHTTDAAALAKFHKRYGYMAPVQSMLGRGFHQHTLILHSDSEVVSRCIDQEIALSPLDRTKVAIVRTNKHGDAWLNLHLKGHKVYRGALSESHSSTLLGAAESSTNVFISLIPDHEYQLTHLVSAHINALTHLAPDGRALIVDGVRLSSDDADLDNALRMAHDYGIHVVMTRPNPEARFWTRCGLRMVFGYPDGIEQSYVEMDRVLLASAPYVGIKKSKIQYVYHSEQSGVRYAAMNLIPDSPRVSNVLSAIFGDRRG